MKVLKFGGSSVGSAERIGQVISIVSSYPRGSVAAVVVSAFQGITDELITAARAAENRDDIFRERFSQISVRHLEAIEELIPATRRSSLVTAVKVDLNTLEDILRGVYLVGECTPRTLDLLMSFGERLSARITSEAFTARGIDAEFLDTRSVIRTSADFGKARVDFESTNKLIRGYFEKHSKLQIVTGFIGSTHTEVTTTLGRGGSDYTAAIVGVALNVSQVEIWTDVDGILTADPRKVPKAHAVPRLTFEEVFELSHFGAKVIFPPTMQPLIEARIPLLIKNTLNPTAPGTLVSDDCEAGGELITGISSISKIALIRLEGTGMIGVSGTAQRLFAALASKEISAILISQASSEHTICCAIEGRSAAQAQLAVNESFKLEISAGLLRPLVVENDLSVIAVVGRQMRNTPGVSGRLFGALGRNGINIRALAQGSSELNISAVIAGEDETKALNTLHDEFFLSGRKTVNVFLAGKGLIGDTLLKQISAQIPALRERHLLEMRLAGICNSKTMRLAKDSEGLDWNAPPLGQSDTASTIADFVSAIRESNQTTSILVDCSASDEVAENYLPAIKRNIAIVTPNKRAFSSALPRYRALIDESSRRRVPVLFETCVGAGLPIIGTLHDLLQSGDQMVSIEAVLSGTLSFVFNEMAKGKSFSTAVIAANKAGYTEPDPRDDLAGIDSARKIVILARQAGVELSLADVSIEPLLPPELMKVGSVDEFMRRLAEADGHFADKAKSCGGRLVYGARIDIAGRTAALTLEGYPADHPFASLQGNENIVVFRTKRYNAHPLVVKGPGAGADVTAAGVFADIIRVAKMGRW